MPLGACHPTSSRTRPTSSDRDRHLTSNVHPDLYSSTSSASCAFGPLFLYPRMQRAGETSRDRRAPHEAGVPGADRAVGRRHGHGRRRQVQPRRDVRGSRSRSLLWVVAVAVSWFLIRPAIGDTVDDARKKMAAGIGVDPPDLRDQPRADGLQAVRRRHLRHQPLTPASDRRCCDAARTGA